MISTPTVEERARSFGQHPHISARSVLVTIFGDSVVPAGGEIWLGDLIELCAPFGISDRLVRTSMFRLTGEGWFETKRTGRRSRYRLTPSATAEFADAEARIYRPWEPATVSEWVMTFLDGQDIATDQLARFNAALQQRGFVPLAPGVMAAPHGQATAVHETASDVGLPTPPPVAHGRFEMHDPAARAWLGEKFELHHAAQAYEEFLSNHRWAEAEGLRPLPNRDAFLLRTMVVHDLRRARLTDPDLPLDLLPSHWPAREAIELAGELYSTVTDGAWRFLASAAGFAEPHTPSPRFGTGPVDTPPSPPKPPRSPLRG
ncbi:MAG: hypothetical protein GY745_16005 [Actinomycetia bacterium]|nr:hypothetical protein [Actinomycetes bacterium]